MVETSSATKRSADSSQIKFDSIFDHPDPSARKTKIICTLGPACWEVDMLVKMLDAGMNVARLNFSHGDHESHGGSLTRLREALKQRPDKSCAIMLDTKGPEIRTGMVKDNKVTFVKDQDLEICTDYSFEGDNTKIACSYAGLATSVKVGSTIFIADGSLTCTVKEILSDSSIKVQVMNNATIGSRKNMNLPGIAVDLPILTEKDENDLVNFGIPQNVDMIAASFVQSAEDIETIRDVLGPRGAHIKIISKIENQEGLNNYDEILEVTDGIMVARGDLGMEIPPEKVFLAQKWMIEKANIASKPVVTATQMLESMIGAPRPTRAEASDVANAVLDGTDCVMLSGESANGAYPINAVTIMAKCCVEAEKTLNYKRVYQDIKELTLNPSTAEAVAAAAVGCINDLSIDLIIVLTDSGQLARHVAKYRPKVPIFAISVQKSVVQQMNVIRGVIGTKMPSFQGTENLLKTVISMATELGLCQKGHKVITIHGTNEETPDESNIMKILDIE